MIVETIKLLLISLLLLLLASQPAIGKRTPLYAVSQDPYAAAMLMDADSGKILSAKNVDKRLYPASAIKLMVLLVILEQIEQKKLQLDEMVQVTVEAYEMGGSQVYLDPREQFSLEDLLYALMIQSANDAAVALAIHVAGSQKAFVTLMNQKAKTLGMKNTRFHSVHGLPPSDGKYVDASTARDFAVLAREMVKRPEVFPYTSTRVRDFRGGKFVMRSHNHLLEQVDGCDGLKTGFFSAAGFSIVATARRGGVRMIAVVMGSKHRKVRDAEAMELLEKGFSMVPAKPAATVAVAPVAAQSLPEQQKESSVSEISPHETRSSGWGKFFMGILVGFGLYAGMNFLMIRRKVRRNRRRR